jgi:hypothetical protein
MAEADVPECATCTRPLTPFAHDEGYRSNRSGLAHRHEGAYGRFVCRTPLCGKNGQVVEVQRPSEE